MNEFKFKQFTISQNKTPMKLSTDSVLLGAWANHLSPEKILDIGTGTGILALMAAQKFPSASIIALEINKTAYKEALENIKNSPWKNRITALYQDFIEYSQSTNEKFDLIISNPPYFENQLKPADKGKQIAKHTIKLSFETLIKNTEKILSEKGLFSVIIPKLEEQKFIHLCSQNFLFLSRRTSIFPTDKKAANRVMLEFSRTIEAVEEAEIIIRKDNTYTPEYLKLTKEFYLFA